MHHHFLHQITKCTKVSSTNLHSHSTKWFSMCVCESSADPYLCGASEASELTDLQHSSLCSVSTLWVWVCIPTYCLLLCKPDCCGESVNAVPGPVYLGHGWCVPPHRASKELWKPVWCFPPLSHRPSHKTVLDTVGNNSVRCPAWRSGGGAGAEHSPTSTG